MLNNENCPCCQKHFAYQSITTTAIDHFNLKTRTVFGHCNSCGNDCEVVQYVVKGEWTVLKYRFYKLMPKAWNKVNDYPVPAVVTGPEPVKI